MKLKQVHELTHPSLQGRQSAATEPEATEAELLATLDAEAAEESDIDDE